MELRWLVKDVRTQFPLAQPTQVKVLQYRVKYDPNIYAGFPPAVQTVSHMVWSPWKLVPEVLEEPIPMHQVDKCPKCGLDIKGAISYTCIQPNCPTGLGGSIC